MNYAAQTFSTTYLDHADYRHRPLPDAEALRELDEGLAEWPARVASSAVAAARAVNDYRATEFGSPAMRELAERITAAINAGQLATDLEAELAELHRAGPARLAHAVTVVAIAKCTLATARAKVAAALAEQIDELGVLRAVLEGQIHDAAVAAHEAGNTRTGYEHLLRQAEADAQWGRICGLQDYHAGRRYQAYRGCRSAELGWEPANPTPIARTRAGLRQRLIGAKS